MFLDLDKLRKGNFMIEKVYIPPIKIQGIKTKLVQTISGIVKIEKDTKWIEPFMGSGVVGFNIAPKHAIFADTNPYIIDFYNSIKSKEISSYDVREFLEKEGKKLEEGDDKYYYHVRDRFNENHNILDFLFLNRCCFNGMIRFNKNYKFNVPYGHKAKRFSKAYVTKIVNQVRHLEDIFSENDWVFKCQSFEKTIREAHSTDFIYCDPPYIGRHVDYYDSWDEEQERMLKEELFSLGANFILSTWEGTQYRTNEYISTIWKDCYKVTKNHYYFIGAKEANRNEITEALLMNYDPSEMQLLNKSKYEQLSLFV